MSSSIDGLNGNGMSLQFEEFTRLAGKSSNVVRFLGSSDAVTVHEVSVTKSDWVGKTLFRSDGVKTANDTTRAIFRNSVAAMFGGENNIPDNVKTAMKLNDYGKGKPLTAKRILAVKVAVDEAMQKMFPPDKPHISSPTAHVRPAWPEGGPVSLNQVLAKGYAPAELQKLATVADLYQKATNCSLKDAQEAALDPKSDASRLFRYGGTFTVNADNFNKGLELVKEFDSWFDEQIKQGVSYLTSSEKLSVEKFVLEEVACNPKLSLNTANLRDLFSDERNLAVPFIKANMMECISGSMAGISPEKRSVVYAMAEALSQKKTGGLSFSYFNVALLSRTLLNFTKTAELVYSGKLNRTTAFNTLFSDLKSIGLSANDSNRTIKEEVGTYNGFEAELEAVGDDPSVQMPIRAKARLCGELFNWSGATIQECRRAVNSGRTIPNAPGVTDVTAGLEGASGLADAGRTQFLNDIYRPAAPTNPRTNEALISEENAVFRFNIDGQAYEAALCSFAEKDTNKQNTSIAKAVEEFCNSNVHPIQTNAVFLALSQGGLAPQAALENHGYKGGDHGAVTYTLTKNAETGSINIKYSNPEGSPVKFNWTATVDVDGKVTSTPIQIEND